MRHALSGKEMGEDYTMDCYEALGYFWEDESTRSRDYEIREDGHRPPASLHHPSWVDAIGIDQEGDQEKAAQVQTMGDIYQKLRGPSRLWTLSRLVEKIKFNKLSKAVQHATEPKEYGRQTLLFATLQRIKHRANLKDSMIDELERHIEDCESSYTSLMFTVLGCEDEQPLSTPRDEPPLIVKTYHRHRPGEFKAEVNAFKSLRRSAPPSHYFNIETSYITKSAVLHEAGTRTTTTTTFAGTGSPNTPHTYTQYIECPCPPLIHDLDAKLFRFLDPETDHWDPRVRNDSGLQHLLHAIAVAERSITLDIARMKTHFARRRRWKHGALVAGNLGAAAAHSGCAVIIGVYAGNLKFPLSNLPYIPPQQPSPLTFACACLVAGVAYPAHVILSEENAYQNVFMLAGVVSYVAANFMTVLRGEGVRVLGLAPLWFSAVLVLSMVGHLMGMVRRKEKLERVEDVFVSRGMGVVKENEWSEQSG